jgi:hypothetical protein
MANVITDSQVIEITDPKLRKVLTRVVREMELSIEKVAANHAKPKEFPLPSNPNSTEHILAARFNALPLEVKTRAATSVMSRINAPAAVRQQRFGDLAAVNLKTNVAVGEQVRAMPMPADLKLTGADLAKAAGSNGALAGANADLAGVVAATKPKLTKLQLRLHKVKCEDETGSGLAELFSDEIDLAGIGTDETGDTHTIAKFRVGSDFDDGEQVTFTPPRIFTTFDLTEGTAFPKSYFVTLVLSEADPGGGLSTFINRMIKTVRDRVIKALAGLAGTSGGPIGAIIGAAVGFVVGKVFDLIGRIWSDDVFPPQIVRVNITSLNAQFPGGKADSPERIVTFKGHGGEYRVTYDWRMVA